MRSTSERGTRNERTGSPGRVDKYPPHDPPHGGRCMVRVFREEDPMDSGYTVVDNDTLWVDLSCRALGLLVRWMSKPPGVEVDTIPDIITRARRRGNKRMEGRDALYTASYELEEEGFLVRRLFTNEKGQHEWAAFIRSRPVPQSERSNPAERKRATAKNG